MQSPIAKVLALIALVLMIFLSYLLYQKYFGKYFTSLTTNQETTAPTEDFVGDVVFRNKTLKYFTVIHSSWTAQGISSPVSEDPEGNLFFGPEDREILSVKKMARRPDYPGASENPFQYINISGTMYQDDTSKNYIVLSTQGEVIEIKIPQASESQYPSEVVKFLNNFTVE